MGFLPLVQSPHALAWELHSVSVVLLVRVRYIRTHPLGFQQILAKIQHAVHHAQHRTLTSSFM